MNLFEAAFRDASTGIAQIDPAGRIVTTNPALARIIANDAPVIGRQLREILPAEAASETADAFDALVAGKLERFEGEVVIRMGNGRVLTTRTRMSPVLDDAGAIESVLLFVEDLSGERAVEANLRAEIAGYEELWRAASSAITILDVTGRVLRIYPGFTRLFGYTDEEAVGRSIHDLTGIDDLDDEITKHLDAAVAGQTINAETVRRRKDGGRVHVSVLGRRFSRADGEIGIFVLYRDIGERKEAEAFIQRLSTTDDLTGLWNRRGFYTLADHEVKRAERDGAGLILLYADLDGFKRINDGFGHAEGDRALVAISHLLRDSCRASDTIARMGGDEFVILASGIHDGEEILVNRIRNSLKQLNQRRNRAYSIEMSIGTVYFDPRTDQPLDLDAMIALADRRMYADKARSIGVEA